MLFQHLFWFYSHPVVYVMVLPGMGVMSELVTAFSYKKIFGYKFIAFSSVGIAVIGFFVWGHHMFYNGMSPYAGLTFSLMSFIVAVPSAIKVYNWAATIHKGSIRLDTPMLYAMGWIGLFVIGGVTGLMLASTALDGQVHDTYFRRGAFPLHHGGRDGGRFHGRHPFLVAEDHRPKVFRAVGTCVGAADVHWLQYDLRAAICARLHGDAAALPRLSALVSGAERACRRPGSTILALAYIFPMIYLIWSLWYGEEAGNNPWGAKGLEWLTTSPPPKHNFEHTPVVDFEPYDYPNVTPEK